jgi:two-component system, sensor histidine kinase and response regulator
MSVDKQPPDPSDAFPERAPAPAAPPLADRANILIVDDRDDKRMAMQAIVADLGENIVMASSGKEALRRLLHDEFAVILLDVNMPGMDGFETAFIIRERKSSEHTPIIFVTAVNDTETHVSRGYSLGAVDYILTPVLPEVLRTKVSVLVELYKKNRLLKRQAEHLRQGRDELELRVKNRTAQLADANEALREEVTARQQAETELRLLNLELEQRIFERTSQLAASNQDLEAFTYSVAHDLEAPLRQIQGYAEIMEEEFSPLLPPEAKQYLERMRLRSENMRLMLEDLLNLSLIGKQELKRERTNLNVLVNDVAATLKADNSSRQIEWKIDDLPVVACDPGLMKLVFTNLLSNAVKYSRLRQNAVIEVGQEAHGDEVSIFVRDNGVGFDMKNADRLFGVFQRLHRTEDFEGTGVGLAIVARIVRKHGGRVWGQAAPGNGAVFYFTLGGTMPEPGNGTISAIAKS